MLRAALALALLAVSATPAAAQGVPLEIDITQGRVEPIPFAITLAGDAEDADTGRAAAEIVAIVTEDLEGSVLFRRIDPTAYLQEAADAALQPAFRDWRLLDAHLLVAGEVSRAGEELQLAVRLWNVYGEREMLGVRLSATEPLLRRIAHVLADRVYERVTGEEGYFDTQIMYISESGPPEARQKRLAVMDQDGANHAFLTDGRDLVLTPRFAPDGRGAVYFSYAGGTPSVHYYDLETGVSRRVGAFEGMSFAPRYRPDGGGLVMSLARGGATNIFAVDLGTGRLRQLTDTRAIDTSPSYSPDGARIAFNSDRSGNPHLFVMDADGGEARRISFGRGSYGTPVWSPRGDYIAFTKFAGGTFYIGLMHPDGSGERLIAEGFLAEGPTWAPNGRILAFARTTPRAEGPDLVRTYTIDITGNRERELPTPEDASDPAWGPKRSGGDS